MPLPRIVLLPPELCNQIAAGEVVERPASVVKELVENSLDALSTRVDVHLESGGQGLIRVQDNGIGMHKDELELALTRHATSKIRSVDDLENINSYGFRGEALPSVASVSRCILTSIAADSDEAWSCQVNFGRLEGIVPAALHKGTLVEIRDLFINVPARLKFLRGVPTEVKHCQDWLSRLALARPDVAFRLESDGRELVNFTAGQSVFERLQTIWPSLITDNLIPFEKSGYGMRVHGYTSLPGVSQPRNTRQLLFVNGRSISDKKVFAAIREAYKGRITSRDHPQVLLFLEMDPKDVDVNVHPAKSEVRFCDESNVFGFILTGLRQALDAAGTANTPVTDSGPGAAPGTVPGWPAEHRQEGSAGPDWQTKGQADGAQNRQAEQSAQAGQTAQPGAPTAFRAVQASQDTQPAGAALAATARLPEDRPRPRGFWGRADEQLNPSMTLGRRPEEDAELAWIAAGVQAQARTQQQTADVPAAADRAVGPDQTARPADMPADRTAEKDAFPGQQAPQAGQAVQQRVQQAGQHAGQHVGPETDAAMFAMPSELFARPLPGTQASEERTPDQARAQHADGDSEAGELNGVTYLGQVADTYLVLRDAAGALLLLDQHAAHERVLYARIRSRGFRCEGQGLAVPLELKLHTSEIQRFWEVADRLTALGFAARLTGLSLVIRAIPTLLGRSEAQAFVREVLAGTKDDLEAKFASMSCKSAIKAGHVLRREEALSLLQQWLQTPEKEYCPHGRPIVLRWDKTELERLFKRRQS